MEKKAFPLKIESDRIVLKKHELGLAPLMFSFVEKDRERLRKFLPWVDDTKSVQDEIDYITMTRENWDAFQRFDYGIFRKSDDQYMGNVGVHSISLTHERCELGF
jgi:RimJ/RimL family protein N-acetyltransferase